MAAKQGAQRPRQQSFADRLRKFFMTRDTEEFERTLEEIQEEERADIQNGSHIHLHLGKKPSSSNEEKPTQDETETGIEQKLLDAIEAIDRRLKAVEEKLSASTQDEEAPELEEKQSSADDAPDDDQPKPDRQSTQDSAALRAAFQEARARAEILAPGLKLPALDAKANARKTTDALCALRRRALQAALQNDHADLVKTVLGSQEISRLTCDAAQAVFNAASELVKHRNQTISTVRITRDAALHDLNERHAKFWAHHH